MENSKYPAFPTFDWAKAEDGTYVNMTDNIGLTKREYFAVKAMQGLLSTSDTGSPFETVESICKKSILIADELLKQLEK